MMGRNITVDLNLVVGVYEVVISLHAWIFWETILVYEDIISTIRKIAILW